MKFLVAAFLLASCATVDAKPKPVAPAPQAPAPPEFIDGADAARVLEAKTAVDTARLRWLAALEEFERKYKINVAQGDGWDEVEGRLKIRRGPPKGEHK